MLTKRYTDDGPRQNGNRGRLSSLFALLFAASPGHSIDQKIDGLVGVIGYEQLPKHLRPRGVNMPTIGFKHSDGKVYQIPMSGMFNAVMHDNFFKEGKELDAKDTDMQKSVKWIKEAEAEVVERIESGALAVEERDAEIGKTFNRIAKAHKTVIPDKGWVIDHINAEKAHQAELDAYEKMTPEQQAIQREKWKQIADAEAIEEEREKKLYDFNHARGERYWAAKQVWELESWRLKKLWAHSYGDSSEDGGGFEYWTRYKMLEGAEEGRKWGDWFGLPAEQKMFEDAEEANWKSPGAEEERKLLETAFGIQSWSLESNLGKPKWRTATTLEEMEEIKKDPNDIDLDIQLNERKSRR